ncbi:uncharacterized protein LOC135098006 [Scylla paramamosain]|uniref:uncharacterized protein LOC135098006 n=1 Tax=Scylla paramamosain TaxID=85552 RepID=UPI0030828CF6
MVTPTAAAERRGTVVKTEGLGRQTEEEDGLAPPRTSPHLHLRTHPHPHLHPSLHPSLHPPPAPTPAPTPAPSTAQGKAQGRQPRAEAGAGVWLGGGECEVCGLGLCVVFCLGCSICGRARLV